MHPVCDKSACRRRQTPKTWRENQLSCRVDRALHGQCVVRSSALDAPAALPSHGDGPRNASRLECTAVVPHEPALAERSRQAALPRTQDAAAGTAAGSLAAAPAWVGRCQRLTGRRARTSRPTNKPAAAPAPPRSDRWPARLSNRQKQKRIESSYEFSLENPWSSHLPLHLQRARPPADVGVGVKFVARRKRCWPSAD